MFWLSLMLLSCEFCLCVIQSAVYCLALLHITTSLTGLTLSLLLSREVHQVKTGYITISPVSWLCAGSCLLGVLDMTDSAPDLWCPPALLTRQTRPVQAQDLRNRENVTEGLTRRFSPGTSILRSDSCLWLRSSILYSHIQEYNWNIKFSVWQTSHKPMHDWLILRLGPFSSKLTDRLYQG